MRKLMVMAAFSAALMAMGVQGAETITVDKVSNHYPWDGKVECVTTLSGLDASESYYEAVFTLSVTKDGNVVSVDDSAYFPSVDGTYTNTFNCTSLFGAGVYPNGGITVKLVKQEQEEELGGVQLWENGPYWAECNVGASSSTASGYCFWWGNASGYTYNEYEYAWTSVKSGTELKYGFCSDNCFTYNRSVGALSDAGYIDDSGNLVSAHDAATAYLGAPWRMPTYAEIQDLIDKCDWIWTEQVDEETWTWCYGYTVRGKESGYTDKSIFLPATGYVINEDFQHQGTYGSYWASTRGDVDSTSDESDVAKTLCCRRLTSSGSDFIKAIETSREYGQFIRPVRTK